MCVFCAAIPVAAATGAAVNRKQVDAVKEAQAAGVEDPQTRPIAKVTGGVVLLLLACSITYHTLSRSFPI
jgi:hypothetical protein